MAHARPSRSAGEVAGCRGGRASSSCALPADVTFDEAWSSGSLRFHLTGRPALVHTLYELMCGNACRSLVRDPAPSSRVRPDLARPQTLRPVGFAEDEGMLPYPRRVFPGYRLLQEYFAFPDKFLFLRPDRAGEGWPQAASRTASKLVISVFALFEQAERQQVLEIGVSRQNVSG